MAPQRHLVAVAVALLLAARSFAAPVDCSDPDNLCTGDPCVIENAEPTDPCVVDFGARAVHIRGLRNVRSVTFTAASFSVIGGISGSVGNGGHFSLTATTGGIGVGSPITFVGGQIPAGSGDDAVQLVAAQAIDIDAPIRLVKSATTVPAAGAVLVDAGTDLAVRASIVSIEGAASFTLSAGGRVDVLGPISIRIAPFGTGAVLLVDAGGDVVVGAPVSNGDEDVTIQAGGSIDVQKPIRTNGNAIVLDAQNGVTSIAPLRNAGRGVVSPGCSGVSILGHAGPVSLTKPLTCSGRFAIGDVTITSDVDVMVQAPIRANSATTTSGTITVASTGGNVSLAGRLDTRGDPPGDVQVTGNAVHVEVSRVDTRISGRQTYTATAGNLALLGGTFISSNFGTIEGSATGNLTATGSFRVGDSGCIAMAAGGTLDTAGATFDGPVVATCP